MFGKKLKDMFKRLVTKENEALDHMVTKFSHVMYDYKVDHEVDRELFEAVMAYAEAHGRTQSRQAVINAPLINWRRIFS